MAVQRSNIIDRMVAEFLKSAEAHRGRDFVRAEIFKTIEHWPHELRERMAQALEVWPVDDTDFIFEGLGKTEPVDAASGGWLGFTSEKAVDRGVADAMQSAFESLYRDLASGDHEKYYLEWSEEIGFLVGSCCFCLEADPKDDVRSLVGLPGLRSVLRLLRDWAQQLRISWTLNVMGSPAGEIWEGSQELNVYKQVCEKFHYFNRLKNMDKQQLGEQIFGATFGDSAGPPRAPDAGH
jgi:hypothetical protein